MKRGNTRSCMGTARASSMFIYLKPFGLLFKSKQTPKTKLVKVLSSWSLIPSFSFFKQSVPLNPMAESVGLMMLLVICLLGTTQGAGSSDASMVQKKEEFKQQLHAAIAGADDLSTEDEDEYTEYVEVEGKLEGYLNDDAVDATELANKYRLYEQNKQQIKAWNDDPDHHTRTESHGKVFQEGFVINKFSDMSLEEKRMYLNEPMEGLDAGTGGRRRLYGACTALPSDHFSGNNAVETDLNSLSPKMEDGCGAIKNYAHSGAAWYVLLFVLIFT